MALPGYTYNEKGYDSLNDNGLLPDADYVKAVQAPLGTIVQWGKEIEEADSGTTDGTTTSKLVDSTQNFTSTVEVGMIVKNTTDSTETYVTAVDSATTLSLNDDIFVSGEEYIIYTTPYLPDGWSEYTGSISDSDSPYNGLTLPTISNFGGDGSDGAYSSSGNFSLTKGKTYQYTNFTINSGDTMTAAAGVSGAYTIIVKCTGNLIINGTIDLSGAGETGTAQSDNSTPNNTTGIVGFFSPAEGGGYTGGGAGGVRAGGGGAGASPMNGSDASDAGGSYGEGSGIISCPSFLIAIPGGAGAGGGSSTNGTGGQGGDGGGSIYFEVTGNIIFTGTINVSGDDGGSVSGTDTGGGGGGGGGSFVAIYRGSLKNSGTETLSGGSGSVGDSGTGGDGGDGKIIFYKEPQSLQNPTYIIRVK